MGPRRRALKDGLTVDPSVRDLLLGLLEQPDPVISRLALDYAGPAGAGLFATGLLVPDGQDAATIADDHGDVPVSLSWSADEQTFGYFSPTRGWVRVEPDNITGYRVDVGAMLLCLLNSLGAKAVSPIDLPAGGDLVWGAGDVRLPHRTHRTPVWFVRRSTEPQVLAELKILLAERPSQRRRLVLASGRSRVDPSALPPGNVAISLGDCLGSDGLALDPGMLAARLDAPWRTDADGPLVVEGEGRLVRLHGKEFHFPRGNRKHRIITYLFDRYCEGISRVSVRDVVDTLDLPDRSRIRDYFKGEEGKRVMSELLFEKQGLCGFRLDRD